MAKIVLFLGALFVLVWLIRGGTTRRRPPPGAGASPAPKPQAMPVCAQCGMHLAGDDVLPGLGGVFCSAAHRADYERAHGTG